MTHQKNNDDVVYLLHVTAALKRWMDEEGSDRAVRVRVGKKLRAEFCAGMAGPCDRHHVRIMIVPQGVLFYRTS